MLTNLAWQVSFWYWLGFHIKRLLFAWLNLKHFPMEPRSFAPEVPLTWPLPDPFPVYGSIYSRTVYLWLLLRLKIDFLCLVWVPFTCCCRCCYLVWALKFSNYYELSHNTQGHNNPFYIEYKNPITFDASASSASCGANIKVEWVPQVVLFVTLLALHPCHCPPSSFIVFECLSVCLFVCLSFTLPIRLGKCSVLPSRSRTCLRFI